VRAGVENGEMVEALGYRIRRLVFSIVFIDRLCACRSRRRDVGPLPGGRSPRIWASEMMMLVFIVVIIGGLGSVEGAFHRRAAGRADGQLHQPFWLRSWR
jgi:branched-chain amino acid transport system permease protein